MFLLSPDGHVDYGFQVISEDDHSLAHKFVVATFHELCLLLYSTQPLRYIKEVVYF